MIVYLDFDGTVVQHRYPLIGEYNEGCIRVIKELQDVGYEVFLNTMRCEFNDGSLEKALDYVNNVLPKMTGVNITPIKSTVRKHSPDYWDFEFFTDNNLLIIDDLTKGIPLKREPKGWMVDWNEVRFQLKENRIL